jgi:hypothetical protein
METYRSWEQTIRDKEKHANFIKNFLTIEIKNFLAMETYRSWEQTSRRICLRKLQPFLSVGSMRGCLVGLRFARSYARAEALLSKLEIVASLTVRENDSTHSTLEALRRSTSSFGAAPLPEPEAEQEPHQIYPNIFLNKYALKY